MSEGRKAVVALIEKDGLILVGKKNTSSKKVLAGKWHIPGETVEGNETDYQALERGMLEEARIIVSPNKLIGTHTTGHGTRVNWYSCTTDTFDVVAGSDLEDIQWVPREKVKDLCTEEVFGFWPREVQEYLK